MNKLFLPYNRTILKTSTILSASLTILSSPILLSVPSAHSPIYLIIKSFVVCILTAGFILSGFYFEIRRKNEYYFYYNLGISKVKLLLLTYCLHMIFIIPFFYILRYV